MRTRLKSTVIITIITTLTFLFCSNSFALEYQTKAGVNFTLLPSISVSLSSASSTGSADLVISDLLPNTSSDSNEIIVNVESNNSTGYVLNSSVGNNTTYASNLDNLVNTASNSYKFTNLALDADLASIDDSEEDNVWGYSYATPSSDDGNGNIVWNTWSNYSGLPLYSDTTNIATLKSSNTPSSASGDNIGFKIAAKASITQGSGEYTNIINFIAVGNPTPTSFYDAFAIAASQPGSTITQLNGYYKMQDMTADICDAVDDSTTNPQTTTLIDVRDNKTYTIVKLAGACWMTQNLAIEPGTHMTADNTNITSAQYLEGKDYYTLPGEGYDLRTNGASGGNCYGSYDSSTGTYSGEGWVNACSHVADDNDVAATSSLGYTREQLGAWYNYSAATAETIIAPSIADAQYGICPNGWTLPTSSQQSSITGHASIYSPIYGGYYNDGLHYSTRSVGLWWSAIAENVKARLYLYYNSSGLSINAGNRYNGYYVRCVNASS